jgi:hypothetical protein
MPDKPKEERLKEGVSLLKQLRDIIKNDKVMPYIEVKGIITEWIEDGKEYSGRVDFESIGRYAELFLPRTASKAATLAFKVVKN